MYQYPLDVNWIPNVGHEATLSGTVNVPKSHVLNVNAHFDLSRGQRHIVVLCLVAYQIVWRRFKREHVSGVCTPLPAICLPTCLAFYLCPRLGSPEQPRPGPRFCGSEWDRVATWLILPVVICLSQRLSHACLSISCLYCETANGSLNQL